MWLILGANGQLGRCLQETLARRQMNHVALGRKQCDITDSAAVNSVLTQYAPEVLVNCAAWTAVDAAEDNAELAHAVNCIGPRLIARACRERKVTLVHISTDYVFSGEEAGSYSEDAPTNPRSTYGRTKQCGEEAVLAEHPNGTYNIRTAWLYSRHGGNFVKTMLRRALADTPVQVVADQTGQPTLADDLAEHIVDLVQTKVPFGTFHGTNSGEATWWNLAREIYDLAHKPISLVAAVGTDQYPTKAIRPRNSVLGHNRTLSAGISEMRHLKLALAESVGQIIAEVEKENLT